MRLKPAILLGSLPKILCPRKTFFVLRGLCFGWNFWYEKIALRLRFLDEISFRLRNSTLFVVCHQHVTMASVWPRITNDSLCHSKRAVPMHQHPRKRSWSDMSIVGNYWPINFLTTAKALLMNGEGAFFFSNEGAD
ncbi:hypothetical protein [Ferribacterium limneticum]|uniref:hypothetical protein n=1 Tax=Ferribacterium limneticum TaxID=76259 RepID=UPI001CF92E2D|nr:hypothetical protein [Ferribacterium limneticum]UCV22190.1 hypothetical protein KI613_16930 [Ferribacterium limneticum]